MAKEKEIWKNIKDKRLWLRYEISNHGRIRNKDTQKILKQNINSSGYPRVSIRCRNFKHGVSFEIHRIVAIAFTRNKNGLPEINHIDTVKTNNYYGNLEWCDRSYNVKHAYDNGVKPRMRGQLCGMTKLSDAQVKAIANSKGNPKKICKEYGVAWSTIYKIRSGDCWWYLTGRKQKPSKRLSPIIVKKVFKSQLPQHLIADKFKVSRTLVCGIKSGKVYKSITKNL